MDKFCKDCGNYRYLDLGGEMEVFYNEVCVDHEVVKWHDYSDPVTGEQRGLYSAGAKIKSVRCKNARATTNGPCGPSGERFIPAPEKVPRQYRMFFMPWKFKTYMVDPRNVNGYPNYTES